MNWFIVPPHLPRPTTGRYPDWKDAIAAKCRRQCVYCSINDGEYGGIDNFHVEHFRPKFIFQDLINEVDNLFIACAICNRFKSDDWPGDPHPRGLTATFLDPSVVDYHKHMDVSQRGTLRGKSVAGGFMIERLFLNRAQLIVSRRYRRVLVSLSSFNSTYGSTIDGLIGVGPAGAEVLGEMSKASVNIIALQARLALARPYTLTEARRESSGPKKSASKKRNALSKKKKR